MNEEKKRDVIVRGYSMENPVMSITLSGILWDTPELVIRSVVEKWGDVKELSQGQITRHGKTVTLDKWQVKLVKKAGITIPPVVFHAGSERSSEERGQHGGKLAQRHSLILSFSHKIKISSF